MRNLIILITAMFALTAFTITSFRDDQKKYSRVRQAYADKELVIKSTLADKSIDIEKMEVYLRAFKSEQVIELWGKNRDDEKFTLIKEYEVCNSSGNLGPKRKQGDFQTPEGYYHINRFNPFSNYHLSLGINYPNSSDRVLGHKGRLGGDIFIHGSCVTIGCLPIEDEQIKELYIYCVEAKNNGQDNIPVTIFPKKLSQLNYSALRVDYATDIDRLNLWEDLKAGYDYFNKNKTLPNIRFLENGRHEVVESK